MFNYDVLSSENHVQAQLLHEANAPLTYAGTDVRTSPFTAVQHASAGKHTSVTQAL